MEGQLNDALTALLATFEEPWRAIGRKMVDKWMGADPYTDAIPQGLSKTEESEAKQNRLRPGCKQILLGWSSEAFTNYLSFIVTDNKPPHGWKTPPHPITLSKRDFSKRIQMWRQWLHEYDNTFCPEGVQHLKADPKHVWSAFEMELRRGNRRTKRQRSAKEKQRTKNSQDPSFWRRAVIQEVPGMDPDYWKAEVLAFDEAGKSRQEYCELGTDPDYWRREVSARELDMLQDSDSGSGTADDIDSEGCVASSVVAKVLEIKGHDVLHERKRKRCASSDGYLHRSDDALKEIITYSSLV